MMMVALASGLAIAGCSGKTSKAVAASPPLHAEAAVAPSALAPAQAPFEAPPRATTWTISSPRDKVRAIVEFKGASSRVHAKAGPARPSPGESLLFYRVEAGGPGGYVEVLAESPLGLRQKDDDFIDDFAFDHATDESPIVASYRLVSGKRSEITTSARERVLGFRSARGSRLELVVRAYDDGIAFRYRFPDQDPVQHIVSEEASGFQLAQGSVGVLLPYDKPDQYKPAYEALWQRDVRTGTAPLPNNGGWCFPALFHTPPPNERWVLLTEADVDGTYFGAHLDVRANDPTYRIAPPAADEAKGQGSVNPSSSLPWQTPWRVVIAAPTLGPVVESTLVTDLPREAESLDWSWVKPGRVSWSWWSDDESPTDYARLVPFIDLASSMSWEYSLIDANWDKMKNGTWEQLAAYAAKKKVGLFLWYNSGGAHNSILQHGPRDLMDQATKRRAEFERISRAGIKGVKVDFFLSDKPWMMKYYLDILKDAADFHLLVNFHGATLPRGWERTYPNLLTMEAVRGAEEYKWAKEYPALAPALNTVLPFTRNVVGPMDYTPVIFTDARYPHVTTNAHELALSVVFQSGLTHFADRVSGYRSLPKAPLEFLRKVPAAWDETRFVDGTPGHFVILARRKQNTWYVAGINGEDAPHDVELDLAFLGAGSWSMKLITDGEADRTFGERAAVLRGSDKVAVTMRAHGGFAGTLTAAAK